MSVESLQKLDLRQIQIIKNLSDTVEIEKKYYQASTSTSWKQLQFYFGSTM